MTKKKKNIAVQKVLQLTRHENQGQSQGSKRVNSERAVEEQLLRTQFISVQ